MRILATAICIALTLVGAACADDPRPVASDQAHEGVTWILVADSAGALEPDAPSDARATIRLEDGEAGGTAACNLYGGRYELGDDGAIAIHVEGMTEMACDERVMALEAAFVDALGRVDTYRVQGEVLVLEGDGPALRFSAERALPLEGTSWRLDGISGDGDTVSSVPVGTRVTATFDPQGEVAGNAGCNHYGAQYAVEGDAISIGQIASTAMGCEPGAMAQEAAFLEALGRAAAFRIQGSTLTLADASGRFLLSFVAG